MEKIGQIILVSMIPERAESTGLTFCPDLCYGIDTIHSPDHVPTDQMLFPST
jgi:hypothetical protein